MTLAHRHWRGVLCLVLVSALAAPGCGKQPVPRTASPTSALASPIRFQDMQPGSGVDFPLGNDLSADLGIKQTNGRPLALLDADGDGLLDLLAAGPGRVSLFRNLGGWKFQPVANVGFRQQGFWQGVAVGDVNGDAQPDIYLSGYGCAGLYLNSGNGRFRDATERSGLECRDPDRWLTSAAFADVDRDGRLDLYVTAYVALDSSDGVCLYPGEIRSACGPTSLSPQRGRFYRGLGGGKFADATAPFGLGSAAGNGLGVAFGDPDADGFPDLYLANDKLPCNLFRNVGGRRYTDIGLASGTAFSADGLPQAGMGVDFGDYDNDGREDLVVTTFQREPTSLYHNEGGGVFTNAAFSSHVGAATANSVGYGVKWADFDNDGLLDLAIANGHPLHRIRQIDPSTDYPQPFQVFHNRGSGIFAELTALGGGLPRPIVGRALCTGDLDNDGLVDLVLSDIEGQPLLIRNVSPAKGHWLRVRLDGPSEGALVTAVAGTQRLIRRASTGGSYLSASDPRAYFGLADASQVETLEVRWPDGKITVRRGVTADGEVLISR